ncbi:MAG: bifunctional phosphopantothenoylcysteine decarboxylase/phosphopantothenate--cysteine ligase CoaBC [Nitrospinae bacterium]|nr:bifunctional phosphopantothenoylcysteine decarboxylase/phosphopantothenate--cysteine ligase CoaBC [Nitrospinota bacterium]
MNPGIKVVLGVTGGIAAYKGAELARKLMELGLGVQAVMTRNAEKFVTPLTFEALTGSPVIRAGLPEPGDDPMPHISVPRSASLMVIAPATAGIIGKMANGIADDTLSTMLLAADIPVIMAPAMNPAMYANQAVQENIARLKTRGVRFVGPSAGEVACGETGEGKLAPVEDIVSAVKEALNLKTDMDGLNVVVTAGGTREPIDAVRYIGNRSSGKMGVAIASAALRRGATVTLISGAMDVEPPTGVAFTQAMTADEMLNAVGEAFKTADMLIMSAAVGDYHVNGRSGGKVKKKEDWTISLAPNPDILMEMGKRKESQTLVGFAAETERAEEHGLEKLRNKNLDVVVINDVSRKDIGFNSDFNEVTIITKSGAVEKIPKSPKTTIAGKILDTALAVRDGSKPRT